ncbi:MAG: hypothetical protein HQL70_08775 [Magnetococcales bacterium]|nr:hypothetical protein [Magnetococcales bacterium]
MKDLSQQIAFIVSAIPRVLQQIDHDPLSPTFGSAHLAYWRDKTSEISDMRRQEVMFPLALLYSNQYPGSTYQGDENILAGVEALLDFWCKNQYSDGSMDEWYKGERAFAAAAFSSHAVARTLHVLDGRLSAELSATARQKLAQTANWLTRRNDLFKTNHQAVGVAALAWAGEVLDDNTLKENARDKLTSIIHSQTSEGWFLEVGHMDIGYTFLTVEFIVMTMALWEDWEYVGPFVRAYDFACEWVHPDLYTGEEYGICHNPYISRIATTILTPHSGRAAYLQQRFLQDSSGFKGFANTLADDLRLPRWAFQPLLAYDYHQQSSGIIAHEEILPLLTPSELPSIAFFELAGVARFCGGGGVGVFAPVAGGLCRFLASDSKAELTDFGYAISTRQNYATNLTYDRKIKAEVINNSIRLVCPMPPVRKFMPPFIARLILRLLCSTAIGSRLTRKGIDIIRRKKGTAINQSSANLGGREAKWQLERQLVVAAAEVRVIDKLTFDGTIAVEQINFLHSASGGWQKKSPILDSLPNLPTHIEQLTVAKSYRFKKSWQMVHIEVVD